MPVVPPSTQKVLNVKYSDNGRLNNSQYDYSGALIMIPAFIPFSLENCNYFFE